MRCCFRNKIAACPKRCLPPELPKAEWLVDPTHRSKAVTKLFCARTALCKYKMNCTPEDAARIKRSWCGYMIKMYHGAPLLEMNEVSSDVNYGETIG